MNFIESFFSWGEKPKEEIKEEIKNSNGRDKLSKRFRKSRKKNITNNGIKKIEKG